MAQGGLKILVNGRVERCYKMEVDFDEASIKIDEKPVEDFNRESFVVMSITKEDMD